MTDQEKLNYLLSTEHEEPGDDLYTIIENSIQENL